MKETISAGYAQADTLQAAPCSFEVGPRLNIKKEKENWRDTLEQILSGDCRFDLNNSRHSEALGNLIAQTPAVAAQLLEGKKIFVKTCNGTAFGSAFLRNAYGNGTSAQMGNLSFKVREVTPQERKGIIMDSTTRFDLLENELQKCNANPTRKTSITIPESLMRSWSTSQFQRMHELLEKYPRAINHIYPRHAAFRIGLEAGKSMKPALVESSSDMTSIHADAQWDEEHVKAA